MTERTLNQRRLDQILPALDPPLAEADQDAVRKVADYLEEHGLFVSGHAYDTEVFHLTFRDDEHQLRYSLPELRSRAADLDETGDFDLAEDRTNQRSR